MADDLQKNVEWERSRRDSSKVKLKKRFVRSPTRFEYLNDRDKYASRLHIKNLNRKNSPFDSKGM